MKAKGSQYKKVVTLLFKNGVEKTVCCNGFEMTSNSVTFTDPEFQVFLTRADLSAAFVKENTFYEYK
ncbi:hypothetical protein [Cytobacillus praedii]|uniref:hypothetical protein n=1 Tax=Cytobacillus praedii TaxID=1742358 RepID=UPI002E246FC7|nr:hypothetical protein [Cytobacillus praedii]